MKAHSTIAEIYLVMAIVTSGVAAAEPEETYTNNVAQNETTEAAANALLASQSDDRIKALYGRLEDHPKVKWKESIKAVVGIDLPTEVGLDQ